MGAIFGTTKGMRSRRWPILGFSLVVIVLLLAVFLKSQPSAESKARQLARLFEEGAWAQIYDLSSRKERNLQKWGRTEFTSLMQEIMGYNHARFDVVTFKGDWQGLTSRYYVHFYFKTRIGQDKVITAWIALPIFRGEDDWYPAISGIPLQLHNLNRGTTRDSLAQFLRACKRCGVESLVRLEDQVEFSLPRLEEYLAGKRKWVDIPGHYHST